jgi:hypothetical protein
MLNESVFNEEDERPTTSSRERSPAFLLGSFVFFAVLGVSVPPW